MATIIINSQDPLINNSRGLKRKRAGGVNFIATRPPAGSVSVESDGEDGFSDMVGDERADSELPEIFMDESPVTRKKRRGVQKVPMPPEHSGSQPTKKKYRCCFQGCEKAYTKPTRLAEHKRSHTGEVRRTQLIRDQTIFINYTGSEAVQMHSPRMSKRVLTGVPPPSARKDSSCIFRTTLCVHGREL